MERIMKIVIRKQVFETNSSSTHSLSLGRVTSKEVDKDASFEIRSREAKIALLFGLIENAEMESSYMFHGLKEDSGFRKLKMRIVKEIEKSEPELLNGYDVKKNTLYELLEIILKMKDTSMLDYYFFEEGNYNLAKLLVHDCLDKRLVLKFKEAVIEEYCKLNNYTKAQAILEIEHEEFANTYIRDALKDEKTAKEKLQEYASKDQNFKNRYKESGMNDIVEFAKLFYEDDFNEYQTACQGKFHCDKYFSEGCLNDCYCGFESYTRIAGNFDLDVENEDQINEKAKAFLSDDCKIIAKEYWNGFCLEKTGEIY